jgi:serine/threonine protein kinase
LYIRVIFVVKVLQGPCFFRDIKLSNILVDGSLSAFLCDWGLSSFLPNGCEVKGLQGTAGFVPYEAVLRQVPPLTYRADYQDTFALG